MVEFAFTVPIIVVLFISVVLLSFMLYSFVTLSHGAREGTRYIVGDPQANDAEVSEYIKTKLGLLDPSRVIIDIDPPVSERLPHGYITIRVTYPFQLVNAYVPYVISPGGITLFPPVMLNGVSSMYLD